SLGSVRHKAVVVPIVFEDSRLGLVCLTFDDRVRPLLHFCQRMRPYFSLFARCLAQNQFPNLHDAWTEKKAEDGVALKALPHVSNPVFVCDQRMRVCHLNPASEVLFTTSEQEAVAQPLAEFIPERFPDQHKAFNCYRYPHKGVDAYSVSVKSKTQGTRHLRCQFRPLIVDNRDYWWIDIQDVTEFKRVWAEHQHDVSRFKTLTDLSPFGILETDNELKFRYANQFWMRLTQMGDVELEGYGWLRIIPVDAIEGVLAELETRCESDESLDLVFESRATPMFEQKWFRILGRKVDEGGMVFCLEDCTEAQEQRHRLVQLAMKDSLTGVNNRNMFLDELRNDLQLLSEERSFALLSIDLDGFKEVNDTLGHDMGDLVLIETANRLERIAGEGDVLARIGGDEFMLLLRSVNSFASVVGVCDKIIEVVGRVYPLSDSCDINLSCSIGAFLAPKGGALTLEDTLKSADIALYDAKQAGRNQYQFYFDKTSHATEDLMTFVRDLRMAFARKQFEVQYQLQYCTEREVFSGMEALVRWRHPEYGLVQPDRFITTLERIGMILPMTEWVLEQALQAFVQLRKQSLPCEDFKVAVNISALLIHNDVIFNLVRDCLQNYNVAAENLVLEITETALISDFQRSKEVIERIRAIGVVVGLDDFGTGHSPLTYISELPADCVKLDKSFVIDSDHSRNQAVVEAVILLAKRLGMTLIAEGVETHTVFNELQRLGCTRFQGFLIHKPCSISLVEKRIQCKALETNVINIESAGKNNNS
ncbi:hypothetical protein A3751_12635, partial [Oleiphilus sp. HI0080]|uniref:sensor domain-containing protein n=1 Tax=Oleiphilus sp. HI0080 TaxID=1822255 RepID=UPI0007C27130